MADEQTQVEPVFLCDGSFAEWNRPPRIQRPEMLYMEPWIWPDASTKLISFLGFDILNERVGNYHLTASAAKYEAMVTQLGEKQYRYKEDEPTSNNPEPRILFAGDIAFFSIGQIPGTELAGYDFIRNGEIFTARKSTETLRSIVGLRELVLDGNNETESIRRIEAIIRGYEDHELARERAQDKRAFEAHQQGDHDRGEKEFGTFGQR